METGTWNEDAFGLSQLGLGVDTYILGGIV